MSEVEMTHIEIGKRPLEQVAAMAQVCLDLHDALGVRWGDDPYARIRELLSLLPRPDVLPPLPPNAAITGIGPVRGEVGEKGKEAEG